MANDFNHDAEDCFVCSKQYSVKVTIHITIITITIYHSKNRITCCRLRLVNQPIIVNYVTNKFENTSISEVLPKEDVATDRSVDCQNSTEPEVLPEEDVVTVRSVDCCNRTEPEVLPEEDHAIARSGYC